MVEFKSPLHEMVSTTPTEFWNDSCAIKELTYAIEHGAVGATTNPVIVGNVLNIEFNLWEQRIYELIKQNPSWTEVDVTWRLIEEMAVKGAKLLEPIFHDNKKKNGRLSIQTNPQYYRSKDLMLQQAIHFNTLAPNMQVKAPVTEAGVQAMEEMTYHGVNVNATVCFNVPQAVAIGQAIENGLKRREAEGKDVSEMRPVVTIMVGRLDDWLKIVNEKEGLKIDKSILDWAGVAVFKKAYKIFKERKFKARLLAAAYRNQYHWTELVGGDIVMTITNEWQVKFNQSGIKPIPKIDEPVKKEILDTLLTIPDFQKSYDPDGMKPSEFIEFGPTARTLLSFLKGYQNLVERIRLMMIKAPYGEKF